MEHLASWETALGRMTLHTLTNVNYLPYSLHMLVSHDTLGMQA